MTITEQSTGRKSVLAETSIAAPATRVWDLLADARGWHEWTRMSSTTLEREGTSTPDGVGAVRRFVTGRVVSREEVVQFDPPHQLSYVLLSGLPMKNYRANVTLDENAPGTTTVTWHSTFDPRYPGTGVFLKAFMRMVLRDLLRRLQRAVEPGDDGK